MLGTAIVSTVRNEAVHRTSVCHQRRVRHQGSKSVREDFGEIIVKQKGQDLSSGNAQACYNKTSNQAALHNNVGESMIYAVEMAVKYCNGTICRERNRVTRSGAAEIIED